MGRVGRGGRRTVGARHGMMAPCCNVRQKPNYAACGNGGGVSGSGATCSASRTKCQGFLIEGLVDLHWLEPAAGAGLPLCGPR
jgi:hypothetical protein